MVFIGISHTFFTSNYNFPVFKQGVPFSSLPWLSKGITIIMLKKEWSTNYPLLDVEGGLLVSIYIHNILSPFVACYLDLVTCDVIGYRSRHVVLNT
jgi:hypothetical protein